MVHEDAEAAVSASAPELPAQRAPEVGEQQTLFELPEQAASVEDGAPDERPGEPSAPPPLGARERAVLDFERRRWKYAGQKEQAIRDTFDMSPSSYFQILNALLDDPAALAYRPTLVGTLRRRRDARRQARQ